MKNRLHLVETDVDGPDEYATEGQQAIDAYLAKVAALDQWVATHPTDES